MAVLYLFAHFDDEFCILPLIRQALARGEDQRFVHMVDYPTPAVGERRYRETRAFLERIGIPPEAELHLGAGTGWIDGRLYRHVLEAFAALQAAVEDMGSIQRIVAPAWEGGHPDHDVCAAMAVRLAEDLGARVDQVSLYNGKGLPAPFFRAASPLPENGPVTELPLGRGDWAAWARFASYFPSQTKTWLGLLPAFSWTYLRRPAFRYQQLSRARLTERPHAGRLYYEHAFKVAYADVRSAVDALLAQ